MPMLRDSFTAMRKEALDLYGVKELAAKLGMHPKNLSRWVNSGQLPRADVLFNLADLLGWKLVKVGVNSDAHLEARDFIRTPEGLARMLDLNQYEVVPMVTQPDSIQPPDYYLPLQNIKYYELVHKSTRTLSESSPNLIAVTVTETAIGTLLERFDVVIVDLHDHKIENGCIYLVRTPEGKTMLRRVARDGERLTFYTTTHNLPPVIVHLDEYGGDIDKAILGRGVRILGDLRSL